MVVVVAANPETRAVLPPLIEARGYEVLAVDCGDEAERRLRFAHPSVLIVDCEVPDGFTVVNRVRSDPRHAAVPVVMLADDDPFLRRRAMAVGATAYVAKGSLDWADLLEQIERYAEPRRRE